MAVARRADRPAAGIWFTRRTARTGPVRAGLLLWGGWLLVTGAVFSFMDGTVHPYYTVALAPAIAALVGISVRELWRGKEFLVPRIVLAIMSAATGVWAFVLLDRTPDWMPALRWVVLVGSIVVAAVVAVGATGWAVRAVVLVIAAALFGLAAPTAFAIYNVAHAHSGPGTMSGPSRDDASAVQGPAVAFRVDGREADNAALAQLVEGADNRWAAASVGSMAVSGLELKTGASIMAIGGFTGSRQLADARAVQAVRLRRPGALLHRERRAWPARRRVRQRGRNHAVGATELHAHARRRHHGVRLQRTNRVTQHNHNG